MIHLFDTANRACARFACFMVFLLCCLTGFSQREGDTWVFSPYMGLKFDEHNQHEVIESRIYDQKTNCCISDADGNLLFYLSFPDTQAVRTSATLLDADGKLIANSEGINVVDNRTNTALLLPWPREPDRYALAHISCGQECDALQTNRLLFTEVQRTADGLGVVRKNVPVINGDSLIFSLTAVRHANGIDWWIVAHQANSTLYRFFLFDSTGIAFSHQQSIGSFIPHLARNVRDITSLHTALTPSNSAQSFVMSSSFGVIDWLSFDRCAARFTQVRSYGCPEPGSADCRYYHVNWQHLPCVEIPRSSYTNDSYIYLYNYISYMQRGYDSRTCPPGSHRSGHQPKRHA